MQHDRQPVGLGSCFASHPFGSVAVQFVELRLSQMLEECNMKCTNNEKNVTNN